MYATIYGERAYLDGEELVIIIYVLQCTRSFVNTCSHILATPPEQPVCTDCQTHQNATCLSQITPASFALIILIPLWGPLQFNTLLL